MVGAVARFAGWMRMQWRTWGLRPRLYAVARFAGWAAECNGGPGACAPGYMLSPASRAGLRNAMADLGLAPQAICCRPLRGLGCGMQWRTWGLRPRLYAVARFAGWAAECNGGPGACAPGYMLSPASRAGLRNAMADLGLAPQAICCRPLRGLGCGMQWRTWGLRPR